MDSEPAAFLMESSTSMQRCVILLIRSSFETAFTPAIIFTQTRMDTRPWPMRSM